MGFLLVDGFSLLSYAAAVEPLRAANTLAGRTLYTWNTLTVEDARSHSSSGLAVASDRPMAGDIAYDTVFVCAAGNPAAFDHKPTFSWLRDLARRGVRLAGVSGGPFVLARAGVLDNHRCTIHWEHVPAFEAAFPRLDLRRTLFEIDRGRLTCGGGVAALDMMHALITLDHGPALAGAVSDWFLQTEVRFGEGAQRMSMRERHGTSNPKVLRALELMEQHLDEPPSRAALAQAAGVSLRQLERLFAAHLGTSVEQHGLRMRLEHAHLLLAQTTLSIVEVSVACGFVSASHFSRRYKARFGISPSAERKAG
jgi:transcriptional regulator GlxA family with amidase domain